VPHDPTITRASSNLRSSSRRTMVRTVYHSATVQAMKQKPPAFRGMYQCPATVSHLGRQCWQHTFVVGRHIILLRLMSGIISLRSAFAGPTLCGKSNLHDCFFGFERHQRMIGISSNQSAAETVANYSGGRWKQHTFTVVTRVL